MNVLLWFQYLIKELGELLNLCELNLSDNCITDILPLSGAYIDTLDLNNNDVDNLNEFDRSGMYWIYIENNRLKTEDISRINELNQL
jgi:hypothetical protein